MVPFQPANKEKVLRRTSYAAIIFQKAGSFKLPVLTSSVGFVPFKENMLGITWHNNSYFATTRTLPSISPFATLTSLTSLTPVLGSRIRFPMDKAFRGFTLCWKNHYCISHSPDARTQGHLMEWIGRKYRIEKKINVCLPTRHNEWMEFAVLRCIHGNLMTFLN